jgi:transposase
MLRVEDRYMIRELDRKGMSISEIARLTGYDRKTVRRVLKEPLVPVSKPRRARTRKIDPYVKHLEARIEEGVLNASKLYTEIRAQGYTGSSSQVRVFVHPYREPREGKATVRFETEPGEQAQVDWGHFGSINHYGRQRWLYGFVMTLGWSRASYLEFTVSADAAWFLRCHLHAFHYLGGVPRKILHDNLKTAVVGRDAEGKVHWNPRYLDFSEYCGFTPRACKPYRPRTKGKVENGIKYVRGNFWTGLRYMDLADLNRQARDWLDTVANVRIHGTTREVPFERLSLENLQTMGHKPDYDTSIICHRKSSSDCLISYDGNYYSVPARYHKKNVMVKETDQEELIILTIAGDEIARHQIVHGHNQRIIESAHYKDIAALSGRPQRAGARQVIAIQPELPLLGPAPSVEVRALSCYEEMIA